MTLEEAKKLVEPYKMYKDGLPFFYIDPKVKALEAQSFIEGFTAGVREAAEVCEKKYLCPNLRRYHDVRWCARCNAAEDEANFLRENILALIPKDGR